MLCKLDSLQGEIIISSNNLYGSPSKLPKNVVHSFYEIVSLRNERNIPQYQTYEGNDECKDVAMDPLEIPKVVFKKHNNRSKLLIEYDIKTIPSM